MSTETKQYRLLKKYESPKGTCHEGVTNTAREWQQRWFPNLQYVDFDIKDDWFELIPEQDERIKIGKMSCREGEEGYGEMKWNLNFKTNKHIHYDKAVELCNILEDALNPKKFKKGVGPKPEYKSSTINPTTEVDKILDIDEAKHVEYWHNEFKVASKSLGEWIEKYCKLEKENEELKATYTEQTKGDVLFTTFDGVEIKDRGTDYYAVHDFRYSGMCNGMGWYHPETGEKYFSTKEAAYDYILRYKPVLCLNDCIVGLPKDLFNKIEQKAKQKLNQ